MPSGRNMKNYNKISYIVYGNGFYTKRPLIGDWLRVELLVCQHQPTPSPSIRLKLKINVLPLHKQYFCCLKMRNIEVRYIFRF